MAARTFDPTQVACAVDGCDMVRVRRVWCHRHYSRWRRHGDPVVTTRAESNPGKSADFRAAYVKSYKLEHGCTDCGYNAHHAALDFDHLPGTVKVRDIKSGRQLGWEALLAEIAKCEVVCANCHRIRTVTRRGGET